MKRTRSITVRLTEEEYAQVKAAAAALHHTSLAQHMREVVLYLAPRWPGQ